MIIFEPDYGLMTIEKLVRSKSKIKNLPNTLYVFGASSDRAEMIYISPDMENAQNIAMFIRKNILPSTETRFIGHPPYANWVAFHRSIREKDPKMCAGVALFLEQVVNNLITW
jgi:hypothetical protein